MVDLARLFSSEGKGSGSTYRPPAGTRCLISGPNMDDDNGYVFLEQTILWQDETFVVYRTEGCWPVINKWEHIIAKPLTVVPVEKSECRACNGTGVVKTGTVYGGIAETVACDCVSGETSEPPGCPTPGACSCPGVKRYRCMGCNRDISECVCNFEKR